jgi:hypothetical protein
MALSRMKKALAAGGAAGGAVCELGDIDDGAAAPTLSREIWEIHALSAEAETLDDDWSVVEARVRERLVAARARTGRLYVCTVFRHVADAGDRRRLARIRALNLLAVTLSRETGLFVIDLDRGMAGAGARAYATDYRLGGDLATEAAAREIATTLTATGLDLHLSAAERERWAEDIKNWSPPRQDANLNACSNSNSSSPWEPPPNRALEIPRGAAFQGREARAEHLLREFWRGNLSPREILDNSIRAVSRFGAREAFGIVAGSLARTARQRLRALAPRRPRR